jgi:uncharacterized membrane protein YvlD (DUF360 family)
MVVSVIVNALALLITAWFVPGMAFTETALGPRWLQAVATAILVGLINLLLRPVVLYIARPLGFFLLFIVSLLLNMAALLVADWLLPGFEVGGVFWTLVASIVLAGVNTVIASMLNLGDDESYYRKRTETRAAAKPFPTADEPGRKLAIIEIDGLSYHHMQKALADGMLPTLSAMMKEEGYVLSKVDCGLPSQTSACQSGIMFGDNDDIPAFRWYDKTQNKLMVSSTDAGEINERYAHGSGLMRGGSSVVNMMNGDAYKSLMTAADLRTSDDAEAKRRAEDVSLLMLDPSFLLSTIARFFVMVGVEVWEGWQQRRNGVEPRLNRLAHFYPFVRAATSVLLRDLGAGFLEMDILRGSPAIYMTWPGYDEVAHHSGPWTSDAFKDLGRFDRTLERIHRTIKEKARGYYDLILLSDHGQSFGATFMQRYGVSIKELIEQQLPEGTSVAAAIGGDTGAMNLEPAGVEFANAQKVRSESRMVRQMAKQGEKFTERITAEDAARIAAATKPANVTAYGSGNLAQVYFDLFPRKITLTELNAAYPGMVDALVEHEGIGLVCGYLDDGTPVALGKGGTRSLHTDEVEGVDPLLMYTPEEGYGASSIETRTWQVRRVMDFPHAGDLMVISSVYPDGTVAALEEQVGSHGGLGGEQTDAFIFHPADMEVGETRNSTDLFHILNDHRGKPVPPPRELEVEEKVATEDWKPSNLAKGLGMVGTWLTHVFRCLIPDRDAFEGVVRDLLMTGPALLVGIVGMILLGLVMQGSPAGAWLLVPLRIASFLFAIVIVYGTGYLLTGKGSLAKTTRALGFAQSPTLLLMLALYEPLSHVVILVVTVMTFIGVWMGAAVAHEARGWKVLLLPLLYVLLTTVAVAAVVLILAGAAITLLGILETLGIVVPPA